MPQQGCHWHSLWDVPVVCKARQQAVLQALLVPSQPHSPSCCLGVYVSGSTQGGSNLENGDWGNGGLRGNKVQRSQAYPSTPCWSRLPRFLRTGSRPRDYVTSGGHGRWCAGLDTSNPARTLTLPDVAPQLPLLWGVEHREGWEATQMLVISLNSHGQPGHGEMPAPTHQQEAPARDLEMWALPTLPHSKGLWRLLHSPWGNRPCSARLLCAWGLKNRS